VGQSFDVLIIGAGIVGAACARELAAAGASVGVIERDTPGSGATAAGMGHIVVMDDSAAQLALTHYSRTLWDALIQSEPERHEYTRYGTIWIAAAAKDRLAVEQKQHRYNAYHIASEILDAPALYALEPNLRPGLAGGLLVPGDSAVYPPGSAARLVARARQHGASLIAGQAARLEPGGVRLADGSLVRGGAVVLANGFRAIDLAPELPIRAKKGHLAITDRYPGFVRHQLVELGYIENAHASSGDSVAFNVQPRGTGQLLIGSSRQFDVQTSDLDYRILSRMLSRTLEYIPPLGSLSIIRVWTGLRAATPDGLPLIGPHPERHGVWLATGHEGLGITTSLGTAKLLAAQIFGHTPEIPAEPYLPSRSLQGVANA
jgi:glycine/D-amino acid oxidase-like deaminating enzyme